MPGAAESSLCISEKCCCEWSHASSALVDVVTEWGGWAKCHCSRTQPHALADIHAARPWPASAEHNQIKHIQAARRVWGHR